MLCSSGGVGCSDSSGGLNTDYCSHNHHSGCIPGPTTSSSRRLP